MILSFRQRAEEDDIESFPRWLIAKYIRHAEQCQLRKCLLPECHAATLWLAAVGCYPNCLELVNARN